jgi:hypothetical protein
MKPHLFNPHPRAPLFCAYDDGDAGCHQRVNHPLHAKPITLSRQCDNATHSVCTYPDRCTCVCHQPAGQFTVHDLALIRQIVLGVIDDGDPQTPRDSGDWELYAATEAVANEQRLRFCDEIARRIIKSGCQSIPGRVRV